MPLRLFFLRQFAATFPVDMEGVAARSLPVVLPEQVLQPVEQAGCRKERGRVTDRVQMVKLKLCINVTLRSRRLQEHHRLFFVAGDIMAAQV